jgi:hypothetical protein
VSAKNVTCGELLRLCGKVIDEKIKENQENPGSLPSPNLIKYVVCIFSDCCGHGEGQAAVGGVSQPPGDDFVNLHFRPKKFSDIKKSFPWIVNTASSKKLHTCKIKLRIIDKIIGFNVTKTLAAI